MSESETLKNRGNVYLNNGKLEDAAECFKQAITLNPSYAEAYTNLGLIFQMQGRLDEAITHYRKAVEFKPGLLTAHMNLGIALKETGRRPEAEATYRCALELQPDYAGAHNNLGILLQEAKRLSEAEASYRRALELQPDYAEAHFNLGILLMATKHLPEAEVSYRRALELKPDYAEAYFNLGILLMETKRLSEAETAYLRALSLRPDYVEAQNNLGRLFEKSHRQSEAEAAYRHVLELKQDYAEAHVNLGLLLLSLGRYAEAWPYFEYRYDANREKPTCIPPALSCPQWSGESLVGKSLVIWSEQGYGDCIQFARYVPLLKERGASRLTFVCYTPLKALLETVSGVDEVIAESAPATHHDYWTFPLSLPLHFGTTVDTIPSPKDYLHALPARKDKWRDRLPKGKFKVGLVWKGNADHQNDANRSLPGLATLAPLWSVPGVEFISLQKGRDEEEAGILAADQPVIHLGSDIGDFADTAAIVDQLDLVICVDTSIAHLAGAMGKPCWVLLPAIDTDWRWLQEREDSPWYPSLRLFRQKNPGDWNQPVQRMRQELFSITRTGF